MDTGLGLSSSAVYIPAQNLRTITVDSLFELFAEVLEVDQDILSDDSSPDSIEEWDSLAAMSLVAAIEGSYDIELSTSEMMKMTTIGIAREVIKSKGVDL